MMELDEVVAEDAGAWRFASQIARNERGDNRTFELIFEIQDIEGNAKMRGNTPGVPDVVERAAASGAAQIGRILALQRAALIPELHRQTNDFFAGISQHDSCGRRIYAAAHGHGNHSTSFRAARIASEARTEQCIFEGGNPPSASAISSRVIARARVRSIPMIISVA